MDFSYSYISEFLSVVTIVMHRIGVKFEDTVFKKWIGNLNHITGWFLGAPDTVADGKVKRQIMGIQEGRRSPLP